MACSMNWNSYLWKITNMMSYYTLTNTDDFPTCGTDYPMFLATSILVIFIIPWIRSLTHKSNLFPHPQHCMSVFFLVCIA